MRLSRRLVESYCVPNFDSPSIFARILDKDKVSPTSPLLHFSANNLLLGRPLLYHAYRPLHYQAELLAQFKRAPIHSILILSSHADLMTIDPTNKVEIYILSTAVTVISPIVLQVP